MYLFHQYDIDCLPLKQDYWLRLLAVQTIPQVIITLFVKYLSYISVSNVEKTQC